MIRLKYAWWIPLAIALLMPALLPSTASASGYNQPHQYPGGGWQTVAQEHHPMQTMMQKCQATMQTMQTMMQKMPNMQRMQIMMQRMQIMMQRMQTMM